MAYIFLAIHHPFQPYNYQWKSFFSPTENPGRREEERVRKRSALGSRGSRPERPLHPNKGANIPHIVVGCFENVPRTVCSLQQKSNSDKKKS
jgi:hypothetical protein